LRCFRERKLLVSLALFSCLFSHYLHSGSYVVCRGADGHVALEEAASRGCSSSPVRHVSKSTHPQLAEARGCSSGPHCGVCIDIPVQLLHAAVSSVAPSPTRPVSTVPYLKTVPPARTPGDKKTSPFPAPEAPILHIRTAALLTSTVLLI